MISDFCIVESIPIGGRRCVCVRGEEGNRTQNASGSSGSRRNGAVQHCRVAFPPMRSSRGLCPAPRVGGDGASLPGGPQVPLTLRRQANPETPPAPPDTPLPEWGGSSALPQPQLPGHSGAGPGGRCCGGAGGGRGMLSGAVSQVLLFPAPRETQSLTQRRLGREGQHGESGQPPAVRRRVGALFEAGCTRLSRSVGRVCISACCISSSGL